ncbi:hypothetical protein [Bacteroides faecium]|uniref:Uncharacterized protein n=1 Tax=Bacteroides faecium TaxID=2715212 RepID=A0A6H0KHY3_9BACE|nr:hypothetical protein [Bacteroides faecium]QIU92895.1 hypothetical protein BacF7301_01445 [Bacteroides faecium]
MEKKIEEEVITITIKYIYNDSGSFFYKKERTVKVGDTIVYTDSMPIDADVPNFNTLVDKFVEWCRNASFSINKWKSC